MTTQTWTEDEGNGILRTVSLDDYGNFTERNYQDAQPILDQNKEFHNSGFGSSPTGELKHAASIPLNIWLKWKIEEGVDVLQPENTQWLKRKLNDPDWRHLRIWDGKL